MGLYDLVIKADLLKEYLYWLMFYFPYEIIRSLINIPADDTTLAKLLV